MDTHDFISRYGAVYEHSPWAADGAFERGLTDAADTAAGLAAIMSAVVDGQMTEDKLNKIEKLSKKVDKLQKQGRKLAHQSPFELTGPPIALQRSSSEGLMPGATSPPITQFQSRERRANPITANKNDLAQSGGRSAVQWLARRLH